MPKADFGIEIFPELYLVSTLRHVLNWENSENVTRATERAPHAASLRGNGGVYFSEKEEDQIHAVRHSASNKGDQVQKLTKVV